MVGTAIMKKDTSIELETADERRSAGLWSVDPCDRELGGLYHVRLYLLQATDGPRLALVRRIQRVLSRTVHGNVRVSAHDLFPVWVAPDAIPQYRLVLTRCGASAGDDVRLEDESTCRPLPHPELHFHRGWLHPDLGGLACPL